MNSTSPTTDTSSGALGDSAINGANSATGGNISGSDLLGAGGTNSGDSDTATIPVGSHGGGTGSGAGLDSDALRESEEDDATVTTSGRLDGTDAEQSGSVGAGASTKAGGGI